MDRDVGWLRSPPCDDGDDRRAFSSKGRPAPSWRIKALASDLIRYFGVSALALGADYGVLVTLHRGFGVHYLAAATLAFTAGLAIAWSLSVALVFRGRRRHSAGREFLGFCLTGIAGLVLTQLGMAALVNGLDVAAEIAKIPVAGGVFAFNFLSRRMLFATPTTG